MLKLNWTFIHLVNSKTAILGGRGVAFCWGLRFVDLVVISQNEDGLRSLLCRLGGYIWGLGSATASLCAE